MNSRQGFLKHNWKPVTNAASPEHYTDDFSSDRGYFTEENNSHNWKIENGVLTASAGDDTVLTYLHIFEKNVRFKARVRVLDKPTNSIFGLMLRYNSETAFVRSGCFLYSGRWFIDSREGADFPPIRYGYTESPIEVGKWYDLELLCDGDTAVLSLDERELVRAEHIGHTSPGRVAIYVERTTVEVDSVDVEFLSGQGTLWKNVVHHKLPDNVYREGGSVFELNDGSLIYEHHSGATFKSENNGCDWERCDTWIPPVGYMNVLRLNNGDWIRIKKRQDPETGKYYIISATSSDDGKTWVDGGDICKTPYHWNSRANAGNMNDKITQAANGRIFYSQNYEAPSSEPVEGRVVFCEFYYSDDNGKTWTKSKTDSWTLGANDSNNVSHFGECKILECDDGTLRMYNSWNGYGCVVYSESKDFGETWGPLVEIPELVCARSSMQFIKDKYADNEYTYYMVWVYSVPDSPNSPMTRSRLSLARSTNGKDWDFLGDIWRWESNYICNSYIAHIVDAFVKTTKDYVICGAGYSEQLETEFVPGHGYHHAQRQHVYSIKKDGLKAIPLKPVE